MKLPPPPPLHITQFEIGGSPVDWFDDHDRARAVAYQLVGELFFDDIEAMAHRYDMVLGGDDAAAGAAMGCFLAGFPGERALALRHLIAVELLRRARRSSH